MRHLIPVVVALAFASPVQADKPAKEAKSRPAAAADAGRHDQWMAGLSPNLRGWVRQQARAVVDGRKRPDPAAISRSVRKRLAGQEFTEAQVDTLTNLVISDAARQAQEDVRKTTAQLEQLTAPTPDLRDASASADATTNTGGDAAAKPSAETAPTADAPAPAPTPRIIEGVFTAAPKPVADTAPTTQATVVETSKTLVPTAPAPPPPAPTTEVPKTGMTGMTGMAGSTGMTGMMGSMSGTGTAGMATGMPAGTTTTTQTQTQLQLQAQLQQQAQQAELLSNMTKQMHDMQMSIIGNLR